MSKILFNVTGRIFGWRTILLILIGFLSSGNLIFGEITADKPVNSSNADSLVVEFYPVPSPDEILEYIDRNSLYYRATLLNDTRNVEVYNTSYDKKVGFGIYLSDLAFALSFEQTGTVINYFGIIEEMGRDLNLFPAVIGEVSERFIKNINRPDSLKSLYTESYILMIDHLDETSNVGSYAIISAGSFIESIYLALNSVKSESEDDAYRLRIWNQKLVFEQLIKIADRHLDRSQKERLFKDIAGVKRVFDSYTERPKAKKSMVNRNGTVVLGQIEQPEGNRPASVQELKNEIELLRRKWVKR